MSTPNEIGDQDLSHEPATPPAGTGQIGKAILTPTAPVGDKSPAPPPAAETAGTDADTGGDLPGTTDAARPGSTKPGPTTLPPPDRAAAGPLAD